MKKKINLYWYKHPQGAGNFGDELNPYIIDKISEQKINYINLDFLRDDKILAMKFLIMALIEKRINLMNFWKYCLYNFLLHPKVLIAIGSVLQFNRYSKCIVWGSGIINKDSKFKNADFLAVRGKYSQARLRELGYKIPEVIGDPALLLPLVYKSETNKRFKIGIIPHHIHFDELKKLSSSGILVIDLLASIEVIIDQINSCELTLSTSLHGIIVSHVYNIPSLWITFHENAKNLKGDNIKFYDYFSSVNIDNYKPLEIPVLMNFCIQKLNDKLDEYEGYMLPEKNTIIKLQDNLLRVAPFALKDEYLKLLN